MRPPKPPTDHMSRREAIGGIVAMVAALTVGCEAFASPPMKGLPVEILCVIRYQIDPFQRDFFKKYAENGAASFPDAAGISSAIFCHMKERMTSRGA
jgi:hypothetical protein